MVGGDVHTNVATFKKKKLRDEFIPHAETTELSGLILNKSGILVKTPVLLFILSGGLFETHTDSTFEETQPDVTLQWPIIVVQAI